MSARPPIRVETDGPVATIRLDRPAVLNALDLATAQAFAEAVAGVGASEARAIVIAGGERAFCAGGDVGSFMAGPGSPAEAIDPLIRALHGGLLALAELGLPTVAAVRGVAAGAGFSLASFCDFVVAGEGARFALAYTRLGATADGGVTWTLPRRLGWRACRRLMLLGETLDAHRAQDLGLVDEVVPDAEVETIAAALAGRLAAGPTDAYRRLGRLLQASHGASLAEQLEAEREAFVASTGTADFTEGVEAFLGKRPPAFRGS